MEKNWVVEYSVLGYYPEDGSSYSCIGPYTEVEAKALASAINKEEELKNLLAGKSQRECREFFSARAVKLGQTKPLRWYQDRIKYMERKLKENKRRGSPDGSSFEMPFNSKGGTFSIADKLKVALNLAGMRLPRSLK